MKPRWMFGCFLLDWSPDWEFEGRKVGDARPTIPRTPTAAQLAALHQLKQYLEDFVRGTIVLCEDWNTILKTTRLDCSGEEIELPEPVTWAQIALALPLADRTASH